MVYPPLIFKGSTAAVDVLRVMARQEEEAAVLVEGDNSFLGIVSLKGLTRLLLSGEGMEAPVEEFIEKAYSAVSPDTDVKLLEGRGPWPVLEDNCVVGLITKPMVMERQFYESHKKSEKLEAIINAIHNALIAIDKEGRVDLINKAAEDLLGINWPEVRGKRIGEIFTSSRLIDVLRTGRKEYAQKFRVEGKSFLSNRTPIVSGKGIVGAVAVLQDISELEMISRELESTRHLIEELKAIIEHSFDGIYVTDGMGNTLRVNKAYERITGIESVEVIGKNMRRLVKDGYFNQSVTLLVLEKKEPVTIIQEIKKTGKTVLVTGTPVYDEGGSIFRVVTNVRDITELNQLKQSLEEAKFLSQHYETQLNRFKIQYGEDRRIVFKSPKMSALIELTIRLSQVDTTVLIQGESGVGKEVVADIIHRHSRRKKGPFVKVNCGAIPENLLESELFGYEQGAFTGAKKGGKRGLLETARNGTVFLDEIGELPLNLQVKLLRVLQSREIIHVGGTEAVPIDVRIIAATNRSLEKMIAEKKFRNDLFYRLNVVPINVPPLRERREDIAALAAHFITEQNQRYGMKKRLAPEVMDIFMQYEWPGNVRELENVVERLMVVTTGDTIHTGDLPANMLSGGLPIGLVINTDTGESLREILERVEREVLIKARARHGSTRVVARALGISQPSVVRKFARHGIVQDDK
ncbi:MAG: sigma 54-interacting transcriptional regulator [Bacillota bacterium]